MPTSATKRNTAASIFSTRGDRPNIASTVHNSSSGFTLLELLIVLSIIVIAASLIIPSISNSDLTSFKAELRQGVSILNYARRNAIVKSSPQAATFLALDPDKVDYEELKLQYFNEFSNHPEAAFWENDEIKLQFRQDQNQAQTSVDKAEFTFFPQGGSTGGILHLSINDMSASIIVDPITGRISSFLFGEDLDERLE